MKTETDIPCEANSLLEICTRVGQVGKCGVPNVARGLPCCAIAYDYFAQNRVGLNPIVISESATTVEVMAEDTLVQQIIAGQLIRINRELFQRWQIKVK